MPEKPTHAERKRCELRVRELADYMAASSQQKRSKLRAAKYRSLARQFQHKEARNFLASWLLDGDGDKSALAEKAEWFRTRMTTSEFEAELSQHNADYIESFLEVCEKLAIPPCEMKPPVGKNEINLGGTIVVYNPDLVLRRVTQKNTVKFGGLFLRYAKNEALDEEAAKYQSAFSFGYLKSLPPEEDSEPEKKLCLTVCAYSGEATPAPGNSIYLFNEMSAACASIAEQWPNIKPPPKAILA